MARPRKTTTVSEDPIDPIEPAAAEEEQILPQTRLEMEVGRQTLARASARLEVPAPAAEPDFQLVLDLPDPVPPAPVPPAPEPPAPEPPAPEPPTE